MRILFAGTSEIAVLSLEKIAASFEPVGVLTSPDKKRGRGKKLSYSPVKEKALELGLEVLQPDTLRAEARERISLLEPDLLAVFAYGKIFGPKFLSLFPLGGINVHPSLLPRYRGSAPIAAALVNGDTETGVSIQKIALEVDTGDVLGQERVPLYGDETAGSLTEGMAHKGAELLVRVIDNIGRGTSAAVKQNEADATICRKMTKKDGLINWKLPADMIERMVRAYNPWPTAYTFHEGKRVTLRRSRLVSNTHTPEGAPGTVVGVDREEGILVQTGRGLLGITELQPEGKKPQEWNNFLNGHKSFLKAQLGDNV
ncbi:MAG: methionyl-tRNA formyltransferase [Spirochaetaceae bacterium]